MKEISTLGHRQWSRLLFLWFSALLMSCSIESTTSGDNPPENQPEAGDDFPVFDFNCGTEASVQRRNAVAFPLDSSVFGAENFSVAGTVESEQSITSDITGVTYNYHVYLPPEYTQEPERDFPVLYWLDAQFWDIPNSIQPMKAVDLDELPVIVVGIEEGPPGRRATDYIFPGINNYNRFFTEEFIPEVESKYRIASEERTLQGVSASGLASLVMMLADEEEPPIFKNHLSFDPYIQSPTNLENLLLTRMRGNAPMEKTLVITSMASGFTASVNPYAEGLTLRDIPCFTIIESIYEGDHFAATNASLGNALRDIYGEYYGN